MNKPAKRLLSIASKYRLIDSPCPPPSLVFPQTQCQCSFPTDKPINHEKPLFGTKALSWKHALIHSRVRAEDWLSKVEMMPGELVHHLTPLRRSVMDPHHPVLISNVELEPQDGGYNVLVYPDNKIYQVPIDEEQSVEFMKAVLRPDGDVTKFDSIDNKSQTILICGHTKRDIRCGMIAPLLKEEFELNLKQRGLLHSETGNPSGIKVGLVSHIGGHAYAGNVLYFDEDGLSIWYGRVENRHVDGIINETVINKKIIKELYRGRY